VEIRLYWPGQTTCYACMWTHGPNAGDCRNGSGSAGGYGYDKTSSAAGEAIQRAGIDLSSPIAGRGDSAVREAIKAICSAMGHETVHIIHTYP